tara:strand:+ start:107 stop:361 length:255 start_codon:yes stop_codon:yes gene_type:complete
MSEVGNISSGGVQHQADQANVAAKDAMARARNVIDGKFSKELVGNSDIQEPASQEEKDAERQELMEKARRSYTEAQEGMKKFGG